MYVQYRENVVYKVKIKALLLDKAGLPENSANLSFFCFIFDEEVSAIAYNGREIIYTDVTEVTRDNVVTLLNDALEVFTNISAETAYLNDYVRGVQPILYREKNVRKEINNKIIINRASEIVDFKASYLFSEPCQYVCNGRRRTLVNELNTYMTMRSKESQDLNLAWHMYNSGLGYRFIRPTPNAEVPFDISVLPPEKTFVVYYSGIQTFPVFAVYIVTLANQIKRYCVYTTDRYFEVENSAVVREERHRMGDIPIIEYSANASRMGAYEPVLSILDTVNLLESNRMDGVEQFVQAYFKFINCHIDDESLEAFRERGAIEVYSDQGLPADVQLVTSELTQSQAQILIDDLTEKMLAIVGMPAQGNANKSDSSNNGAIILRNGWEAAEARAKQTESFFRAAEFRFLQIVLNVSRGKLKTLSLGDIGIVLPRRSYTDLQTKSQVITTLLGSDKIDPYDAYVGSNMFPDANAAYTRGMAWYEKQREGEGTPNNANTAEGTATPNAEKE